MTVIVALNNGREILIGYNNGSELGGTPVEGLSNPWIVFGDWALGVTGESSVQRLLASDLETYAGDQMSEWKLINFINDKLLEKYIGSKSDTENVTTFGIYCILVNANGKIWDVSSCLSLTEIEKGKLWSRGSGSDYALGAGFAFDRINSSLSQRDVLKLCVEAAIQNDIYCVGQAVVKSWDEL
jgi:ATP-dependent protease HslVU (ClpYQ) peptidase subunit